MTNQNNSKEKHIAHRFGGHHLERRLDRLDVAAAQANPWVEYPSVKRERLYRETIENTPRPPVVKKAYIETGSDAQQYNKFQSMRNPEDALKGVKAPWAILEYEQDNDPIYGGASITWLACESKAEAVEYCEIVGWEHEKPGPGEYDGVYTYRKVFSNPHLEQRNIERDNNQAA